MCAVGIRGTKVIPILFTGKLGCIERERERESQRSWHEVVRSWGRREWASLYPHTNSRVFLYIHECLYPQFASVTGLQCLPATVQTRHTVKHIRPKTHPLCYYHSPKNRYFLLDFYHVMRFRNDSRNRHFNYVTVHGVQDSRIGPHSIIQGIRCM